VDGKRPNPYFRQMYEHVSASPGQTGELPYSFEAREHTAQVDQRTRAWREDRFRYSKNDQLRIEQNKGDMQIEGEPTGFLPVMFCSPTMELGVDISALNTVYMRNVPPCPHTWPATCKMRPCSSRTPGIARELERHLLPSTR
jgi:hypothetical protein